MSGSLRLSLTWNQLNDQQKSALAEAGHRTQGYMRGAWKVSEVKDLQQLKGNFTEIINVDKAPFVKSVSALVSDEAKRLGVEKTVAFILDTQKNF